MKLKCVVCDAATAVVVCCSDDSVLCSACDVKVHATPITSHHRRLLLSEPSLPRCDNIRCQAAGFFFCKEDRKVLCRKCDVFEHTPSERVSPAKAHHERIFISGVGVGPSALDLDRSLIMPEFFEFEGNSHGVCDLSSIVESVNELLNDDVEQGDDNPETGSANEIRNEDVEERVVNTGMGPELPVADEDVQGMSDNMGMDFNTCPFLDEWISDFDV